MHTQYANEVYRRICCRVYACYMTSKELKCPGERVLEPVPPRVNYTLSNCNRMYMLPKLHTKLKKHKKICGAGEGLRGKRNLTARPDNRASVQGTYTVGGI